MQGEGLVMAEPGVLRLQTEGHQALPAAAGSEERGVNHTFPWSLRKDPNRPTP